ncbi:DUF3102 domain-containing protein [Desulfosporosinus fructosivorans]|uniref:DUF3102 domain-containing protein n=1 Tax=Desulfosporosinus fructosivorans TaxID=2018669 RepID=A0A4Z0R134_9FIRM|nr:DUF3102 domain-containing protein [Desulfosporosinus fructosivorans]TGE36762.1 DUF3102 domain-containing protein [Desulfosporosinus fructosivorans]
MRMASSNRTPEQIASEEESPNVAPVQHLNYTQGLILFGIPVEDRDQFIADNDVGNMSLRGAVENPRRFKQSKSGEEGSKQGRGVKDND